MRDVATNMPDYQTAYKNDRLEVPEYFNFGFDVVDTVLAFTNTVGAVRRVRCVDTRSSVRFGAHARRDVGSRACVRL